MSVRPNETARRVADICLEKMMRDGVTALIVDLDNTVAPWNEHTVTEDTKEWLGRANGFGLGVCLLSNNHDSRVRPVAEILGLPFVCDAGKPNKAAFLQAARKLQTEPGQCAVIGDQYFTDVLGGHRAGMRTVLVNPLSRKEFFGTRIARVFECVALYLLGVQRL